MNLNLIFYINETEFSSLFLLISDSLSKNE